MINLSLLQDCKALSLQIKDSINAWCEKKYASEHREHLGASIMGEACSRKLWYSFHWVKLEQFNGRMQRLFQVGHNAEPRFKEYLEGIGFRVDLTDPMTGNQFRVSAHNGHYGGSLDGIGYPYGEEGAEPLTLLLEFKTNGTGSGFNDVGSKGVAKAKPKHFAQMSQYGYHYKLKYGLYLIENKNDSDITVEIVQLDWNLGEQLQQKAGEIINAKSPPEKIWPNESYHECKYCTFVDICHNGEVVETNCRSCKYSEPVENAEWKCNKFGGIIPKDFIKKGCPEHVSINE